MAVASNFIAAAKQLADEYQKTASTDIVLSFSSSGKIFAQIVRGAPFDVFLSADQEKPLKLQERGLVDTGDRFTYALGTLMLWSADNSLLANIKDLNTLSAITFNKIAMANPRTAPYGQAALQTLQNLGLNESFAPKTVTGESISQTFMFVQSKNAQLGFIAYAQYIQRPKSGSGSGLIIPAALHDPIKQDAVLLTRASPEARGFFDFLTTPQAKAIIAANGYQIPGLSPNNENSKRMKNSHDLN